MKALRVILALGAAAFLLASMPPATDEERSDTRETQSKPAH